jgi:hypothetical protein
MNKTTATMLREPRQRLDFKKKPEGGRCRQTPVAATVRPPGTGRAADRNSQTPGLTVMNAGQQGVHIVSDRTVAESFHAFVPGRHHTHPFRGSTFHPFANRTQPLAIFV